QRSLERICHAARHGVIATLPVQSDPLAGAHDRGGWLRHRRIDRALCGPRQHRHGAADYLAALADRRAVRAHRWNERRLRVLGDDGCDPRRSGYGPGQMSEPLIEATDIVKYLGTGPGRVHALRGVSLSVSGGELVLL